MSGRVLVTPPSEEPLTLAEAKLHLRVERDQTEEDDLIGSLVSAARQAIEEETGRAMLTQTWRYYLDDRFPMRHNRDIPINLPMPPIQEITHVKYYDIGGVLTTLPSTDYFLDASWPNAQIALPYGYSWPAVSYAMPNAIEIEYIAGYATIHAIPPALRAAVKLLLGTFYQNRESVIVGTNVVQLPDAVDRLIGPHRVLAVA